MKTSAKILTGITATAIAVGTFHLAQEQTELDRQRILENHATPKPVPTHWLKPESSQKISDAQLLRPVPAKTSEKPSKAPTKKPTTKPSPKPVPVKPTPTQAPQKPAPKPTWKPKPKPTVTNKPKPPVATASFTIGGYKQCGSNYQACIDAGGVTLYAGNILAGHDYMGFAWAYQSTKIGTTIRVSSGAYAGTYKVQKKAWIPRQSGSIPGFVNNYPLVLQTCSGNGTGFALLVRS